MSMVASHPDLSQLLSASVALERSIEHLPHRERVEARHAAVAAATLFPITDPDRLAFLADVVEDGQPMSESELELMYRDYRMDCIRNAREEADVEAAAQREDAERSRWSLEVSVRGKGYVASVIDPSGKKHRAGGYRDEADAWRAAQAKLASLKEKTQQAA